METTKQQTIEEKIDYANLSKREKEIKGRGFWNGWRIGGIISVLGFTLIYQPLAESIRQTRDVRSRESSFLEQNVAPEHVTNLKTIDRNFDGKRDSTLLTYNGINYFFRIGTNGVPYFVPYSVRINESD